MKDINWSDVIHYASGHNPEPNNTVVKTEAEWKTILSEEQYFVTRLKGTERAHTGEFCSAHEPGLYACVCCDTLLFDSREKFESGTGWPSFTQPVEDNVILYEKDEGLGMIRVEVMCNVCKAHLGHVFPDGPPPSGLRYCINSASLKHVSED